MMLMLMMGGCLKGGKRKRESRGRVEGEVEVEGGQGNNIERESIVVSSRRAFVDLMLRRR